MENTLSRKQTKQALHLDLHFENVEQINCMCFLIAPLTKIKYIFRILTALLEHKTGELA